MLLWNKTYHDKGWIRHVDKIWLIEPKNKLYQKIEKLSVLLACSEALFVNGDITKNLDKRRESLLEWSISGRHLNHYLW